MTTQLTDSIRRAELDLERFEATTTGQDALARLSVESPSHPLLVSYWALRGLAGLMAIATCATLATPVVSDTALKVLASSPMAAYLPAATLVAALGFLLAAVGMRQAAITRGMASPLLPTEQKQHLKLVHEVQQLAATRRVRDRATPAPARARATFRAA